MEVVRKRLEAATQDAQEKSSMLENIKASQDKIQTQIISKNDEQKGLFEG